MARQRLWQVPLLRHDEEHARHRPVTWLELFFDLFVVVAVAQLSRQLSEHLSWGGLGGFVFQFVPLFWVWVGLTYYQERFETDGLDNRLIILAFMLLVAGMAVFAPRGLGTNYPGYVLCYVLARGFTLLLWIRAGLHNRRLFGPIALRYAIGFSAALSLSAASILLPVPHRLLMLGAGLLLDILTPLGTLEHHKLLPRVSSSKYPERFGLFTLIVLGETVTGVVAGVSGNHQWNNLRAGAAGMLSVTLGFCLWWIYFDFVGRRPFRPSPHIMYAWVYLHLLLFLGIVAAGAGIRDLNLTVARGLASQVRWLVCGSVAAFLVAVALLETLLVRRRVEPTHPVLSPLLKLLGVPLLLGLGLLRLGPILELAAVVALLGIQMGYGLHVWLVRDLPETS